MNAFEQFLNLPSASSGSGVDWAGMLTNGAHWLARSYVGLDPVSSDNKAVWSMVGEKLMLEMGDVAINHYAPSVNGNVVSVPNTRFQGDFSVVHLAALKNMAKSFVSTASSQSTPQVNLLQQMNEIQHMRGPEMEPIRPRTTQVRSVSPRRRQNGQVQARQAPRPTRAPGSPDGIMRALSPTSLSTRAQSFASSPAVSARGLAYTPQYQGPPVQAQINTGNSSGFIRYTVEEQPVATYFSPQPAQAVASTPAAATPAVAQASPTPADGIIRWASQINTGALGRFTPFAPCPSTTGGPFQMSCETQHALAGAFKNSICNFMTNVVDDICDDNGNLNTNSVLLNPSDSGSGSAWKFLLGKLACSMLTAIPSALCPPEDSAPKPAFPVDPDCNFAVEGT